MTVADRAFPFLYGLVTAPAERGWLGRRRSLLVAGAAGTVLEIGGGLGANVPHYEGVERVLLCEPSPFMRARLGPRLEGARVPVQVLDAPAEALPCPDGSVDTVVSVFVLCTVSDVTAALAEVRRVLRPGGRLCFLEHVRGGGWAGRWQDRIDPLWCRAAAGCHLNRRSEQAITVAGFAITDLERFQPPVPGGALMPMVQGTAVRLRS